MTRDEILAMKPGAALDALVAEKVMGYKAAPINHWLPVGRGRGDHPAVWLYQHPAYGEQARSMADFRPSRYIAAAWEVVEALHTRGIYLDVLSFADFYQAEAHQERGLCLATVAVPTAPEAICKAALIALAPTA